MQTTSMLTGSQLPKQETVERAGSGFGAALASGQVTPSTQRGILSTVDASESFPNPLLTT